MCEAKGCSHGVTAPVSKGSSSRLGKNTKSSPPPSAKDAVRAIRRERYELARIARSIYAQQGAKQGLDHILNYHRTAKCGYIAIGEVAVQKSVEFQKCFFSGLMLCGSVWTCPNCAAKIQERRRLEVAQGMNHMIEVEGKKAVMVTFTFPHGKGDDLQGLLDRQKEAFKLLRRGKAWDKFKERNGFDGLIRSLEVTYGDHGWHPHTHELWFVDRDADAEALRDFVTKRWMRVCARVGLVDDTKVSTLRHFAKHGVDVRDNASTSDYLAKQDASRHWGADREIAKATTKQGKRSGMHPFMFLTNYNATDGEAIWAKRWLEYTEAFRGKAQLFWSHGLKKRCEVDDISDEALAVLQEDEAVEIYKLTTAQWRRVAKHNRQAFVLETCEDTSNRDEITKAIRDMKGDQPDMVELLEDRRRREELGYEVPQVEEFELDEFAPDFDVRQARQIGVAFRARMARGDTAF